MDATIQGLRLPEGFAGMLEDNGLPLPPLPLEAINELEQTDEWFFATDGREPLSGLAGLYLEDLDAVFDSPEAPQSLRDGPVRYLGCIGSRRKLALCKDRLLAEGFTEAEYACVHAPIGLAIGAETPEEIAVSIAAELIAVRAGKLA